MGSELTSSATRRALPVVPSDVTYAPASPGASSYEVELRPEAPDPRKK